MKTETIRIVDHGRGPQLSTSRITVLDVFYYLYRRYEYNDIHQIMPSLSREEFETVRQYVEEHYEELVERDRQAEEFVRAGVEAQRARGGIFAATNECLTTEERVARLKRKMRQRLAEKNGEGDLA